MSSSIPNSAPHAAAWRSWLVAFAAVFAVSAAIVALVILLLDPYDSGRYPVFRFAGIDDENPRSAVASRGRDPQFNAAVVGDSSAQLLEPASLSRLTGLSFVQLTVPSSGPREQLAILDWFVLHHRRPGGMVIDTDAPWCAQDAAMPILYPFPFWLYGESDLDYLRNVFNWQALGRVIRRVKVVVGLTAPIASDGYSDYEINAPKEFHPNRQPPIAHAARAAEPATYPAIAALKKAIAALPPETPVALVMPPVFFTQIEQGPEPSFNLAACKAALRRLAAGRAHTNFLDFRIDTAITRNPANFVDYVHYRAPLARRIEHAIADAIRSGKAATLDF